MNIVVPLAGPDFVTPDGLKGDVLVDGKPLLPATLMSRPWASGGEDLTYCFVFHDENVTRRYFKTTIKNWFPSARGVFLSDYTAGAALSALAGVSTFTDQSRVPLIIDLADIQFSGQTAPQALFEGDDALGAVLPVFEDDFPGYSYAELDADEYVLRTAEKKVISTSASAGVYMFRNGATYQSGLARVLADASDFTHNGLHFVCPVMNGVIANDQRVLAVQVDDIIDIKKQELEKHS